MKLDNPLSLYENSAKRWRFIRVLPHAQTFLDTAVPEFALKLDVTYKFSMVSDTDFKNTLEKAKSELISNQERLGKILQEQESIETRNAKLREIVAVLSRAVGEQFVEEDAIGLTDAIRGAFRGAGGPLQPTEVRDRLKSTGVDITKYGNVMASVHSVISRLHARGDIQPVTVGGKPAFTWNHSRGIGAPPSKGTKTL
ncbi:hypothetical protein [Granulicella aggregans]|uniref:hypothetical protein n=1 Tax=Granulicella aggregans TaxID=474949 RepID=UPI0021DF9EB3|nr:hypothetical protein [Granulicella aggregans]